MPDARTYVRVADDFDENPKIEAVGEDAAWLYIAGLCYCGRNLTDGAIPKSRIAKLVSGRSKQRAAKLVAAGLWIDKGDTYLIHDYLEHQRSREQIENERRKARERAAKSRRTSGVTSRELREPDTDTESDTEGSTPPTPPPGGQRAKGTNPRAVAAKRERDRITALIDNCPTCGDNPAFWCQDCTGLRRKLSEVSA